jgi:hypothetical protein
LRGWRPRGPARNHGCEGGLRGLGASSGEVDRERLDVPAANRRLSALIAV